MLRGHSQLTRFRSQTAYLVLQRLDVFDLALQFPLLSDDRLILWQNSDFELVKSMNEALPYADKYNSSLKLENLTLTTIPPPVAIPSTTFCTSTAVRSTLSIGDWSFILFIFSVTLFARLITSGGYEGPLGASPGSGGVG